MKIAIYVVMLLLLITPAFALDLTLNIKDGQTIHGLVEVQITTDLASSIEAVVDSPNTDPMIFTSENSSEHLVILDTTSGDFPDGIYNLNITAKRGSEEEFLSLHVDVDNTPPALLEFTLTNIKTTTADLRWTTSELSTGTINYGNVPTLGVSLISSDLTSEHEKTLEGLSAGKDYYFTITVCDAVNNCATSGTSAFVTALETASTLSETPVDSVQGIQRYKGSLVVTKYGIYQTYKLNAVRGLIFRTATEKRVKTRIAELTTILDTSVKFRIEDNSYTLNLGTPKEIDFDKDGLTDLEITLLSIPDPSTAKFLIRGKYTAITDEGLIIETNIVEDFKDELPSPENQVIDEIIEVQNLIKQNQSKLNWILIGIAVMIGIFILITQLRPTKKKPLQAE